MRSNAELLIDEFPLRGMTVEELRELPDIIRKEAVYFPASPFSMLRARGTELDVRRTMQKVQAAQSQTQDAPGRTQRVLLGLAVMVLIVALVGRLG